MNAKRIFVIGAGPAGYTAALRAAQLGAEVTIVEQEAVGGTCLNHGCIPSKFLKTTAETLEKLHNAESLGIKVNGDISLDINTLMTRKSAVIETQAKAIHKLLDRRRVRYVKGRGTIEGSRLASVKLSDGNIIDVEWDALILAMGSQPLELPSFPFDGNKILSSTHALKLQKIPESILIVGGGVIGCELAFILNALGSKVTVVEALSRMLPLPSVDEDCSKTLQREMKKRRIAFMINRIVEKLEERGEAVNVILGPSPFAPDLNARDLKPLTLKVEKVLVCIGRKPNTTGVGLERIGIRTDKDGWIIANERMETNVAGIYAIGDLLGPSKVMLAHVASAEALVAAENALGENSTMNYGVVPGAIFTMPEVANVGLTEVQAREQGYNVRADSVLFRSLGKAQAIGEIAGHAKIVSDADNGKILGVHIIGPQATDLIAEGTLAIQLGCTVKELAGTIHAHPTLSEILLETSYKALDRSFH